MASEGQVITLAESDDPNAANTITFTDTEGNVITSAVMATDPSSGTQTLNLGEVTVVAADQLTTGHFFSPVTLDGNISLKLEPGIHGKMEVVDPVATIQTQPFEVVTSKKKGAVSESEKKICLWPTGNGTTCGKAFAKFDSLKRHLTEAHKGIKPFGCKLCDKTYGRRDYLQRHLKSHNASYAVNLAGGNAASLSSYTAATASRIKVENASLNNGQPSQPGTASGQKNNAGSGTPFLNLYSMQQQTFTKPLGSKICRWVQDDGTVCGKAFCKLDSLRRHVSELHKGVRPFACGLCDKNYGRKDYLDRHVKTHDPAHQKARKPGLVDWGTGSGVVSLLNSIKEEENSDKPKVIRKKRKEIPAEEKKICLWVLEDGTACGKTFTKFDSLKRHVSEGHKNVRPYSCTLCGKTYGRRDYLLRHLKCHNETDLANLAANATKLVNANSQQVNSAMIPVSGNAAQPIMNGTEAQNSQVNLLATKSSPSEVDRVVGGIGQITAGLGVATLGMKKRTNDKKTCRWVLDNGTICGRSFSKFDSLRRHVQELHKGVRPFVCQLCQKSYGRKDYLDRHIKTHTETNSSGTGGLEEPSSVVLTTTSGPILPEVKLSDVSNAPVEEDDLSV